MVVGGECSLQAAVVASPSSGPKSLTASEQYDGVGLQGSLELRGPSCVVRDARPLAGKGGGKAGRQAPSASVPAPRQITLSA